MAKLVKALHEDNDYNNAGSAPTLYFDTEPNEEEVKNALLENSHLCLADEQFGFNYQTSSTPHAVGLVRCQVYPS